MADSEIRNIERRWLDSQDIYDEVALINARINAGLISTESVELAAYLGHEAAQIASQGHAITPVEDLTVWLTGIKGRSIAVRCGLGLIDQIRTKYQVNLDDALSAHIKAAAQLCLCWCRAHADEAINVIDHFQNHHNNHRDHQGHLMASLARNICSLGTTFRMTDEQADSLVESSLASFDYELLSEEELRKSIREFVAPFLVGHQDPLVSLLKQVSDK